MDVESLTELFQPFGAVSVKRMFGGHGVYADDLCFAIEMNGDIFLKVDDVSRAEFEVAGAEPFTYASRGKLTRVGFWSLAASAYDEPDELRRWSRLALEAARRAAGAKAARLAKTKRRPK